MKLIINNRTIELKPEQKISRTLQVNDILSLSNRQSNYTNTFTIEKTDVNKQTFDFLGEVGSPSVLPYLKNECYLYTDDGECLVYKGWAVIQSTDKDYKINIYDGNIDLYKAIENKTLGDLDLSEIDHNKLLSTVLDSWTAGLPYKYIIADFNGLSVYDTTIINLDYLVPSVKISYLWDKIFSTYGFTYEGIVFDTVNFTNLWMTYPKFSDSTQVPVTIFEGSTPSEVYPNFAFTNIVIDNIQDVDSQVFIIETAGTYDLNLSYGFLSYNTYDWTGMLSGGGILYATIFVNGIQVPNGQINLQVGDVIACGFPDPFLNNGEEVQYNYTGTYKFDLIIKEFEGVPISFTNELKDFSVKDFISEILNRFGLTPYKDKYTNHYKFLTLQELLQNNTVVDWSREKNKFVDKISERYIFGSYAQCNYFNYKYNDPESIYYDGKILINNVNLPDNKVVVPSKIYAPEKDPVSFLQTLNSNVYKIWDKEVQDTGAVKYKGLSKRYYFLREASHTFTEAARIGSANLLVSEDITNTPIPVEAFYLLRMEDIVNQYYANIGSILNYSKIIDATIYLSEKDISDMDFSRLYWIKQLSSYFILNKVNNFEKKGTTKVELIQVVFTAPNFEPRMPNPFIHFGLSNREITIAVNQEVTIYQDTIYTDNYSIKTIPVGSEQMAGSNQFITIKYPTAGVYTANIEVELRGSTEPVLQSNNLKITVI